MLGRKPASVKDRYIQGDPGSGEQEHRYDLAGVGAVRVVG
jgi:hypothetical protein